MISRLLRGASIAVAVFYLAWASDHVARWFFWGRLALPDQHELTVGSAWLLLALFCSFAWVARLHPAALAPCATGLVMITELPRRYGDNWRLGLVVVSLLSVRWVSQNARVWQAPPPTRRVDAFSLALLATTVAVTAHHAYIGSRQLSCFDNDAAYYYGVARAIARTGELNEPVIWNLLTPQAHVVHPAFDYWQGLTSVILAGAFRLFGVSHRAAGLTMGIVAGTAGVGLWHLLTRTGLVRHRLLQLGTILAFAFVPALAYARVDSETGCVFQMVFVGALVALASRHFVLATVLAFVLVLVRADGAPSLACVVVAALVLPRRHRDRARVALTAAVMISALLAFYWHHFGTFAPPGVRAAATLRDYHDLYRLHPKPLTPDHWRKAHFTKRAAFVAYDAVRTFFHDPQFVSIGRRTLPLAVIASTRWWGELSERRRLALTFGLMALALPLFNAWASPLVFAHRSIHGLLPLLMLVTAIGIDALLDLAAVPAWSAALAEAGLLTAMAMFSFRHSVLVPAPNPVYARVTDQLHDMTATLGHSTVLASGPWWVVAETNASAVVLPLEGTPEAVAELVTRYDARYVLVAGYENWPGDALARWRALPSVTTGPWRYVPTDESTDDIQVFRVVPASEVPSPEPADDVVAEDGTEVVPSP